MCIGYLRVKPHLSGYQSVCADIFTCVLFYAQIVRGETKFSCMNIKIDN